MNPAPARSRCGVHFLFSSIWPDRPAAVRRISLVGPFDCWSKMMKLYSQKDVDKKALRGARIAVLGYGSQGRAHALNLKDSGFDVVVGVRKGGAGWKKAKKDGLEVAEPAAAARGADLVAMMVPDLAQKSLYESIAPELKPGATLL
ncbi:MAG TPA: NAD(P)-binding domain-containing protein, partial [Steroidobacteraceae bacterium]|nr:NAD(P)-binding domain-containing protein [Steroidobacteraceae bacterium]